MRALRAPLGALLLALALVAAPGCDSSAAETIGGTYVGTTAVSGLGQVTFRLVLPTIETGSSFRYTGSFRLNNSGAEPFSGAGEYDHPDLEMTDDDDPSEVIRGTVSAEGDRITLVDAESGQTIVLAR